MWVIIQELPPNTTERELCRFVSRQLGYGKSVLGASLGRKRVKSCAILQMTEQPTGSVECCGLVELESDKPDDKLLRQLNGLRLRGNRLTVRKYYHRSHAPKAGFTQSQPRPGQSGLKERRRSDLQIERYRAPGNSLPGSHLVRRLRRSIS